MSTSSQLQSPQIRPTTLASVAIWLHRMVNPLHSVLLVWHVWGWAAAFFLFLLVLALNVSYRSKAA